MKTHLGLFLNSLNIILSYGFHKELAMTLCCVSCPRGNHHGLCPTINSAQLPIISFSTLPVTVLSACHLLLHRNPPESSSRTVLSPKTPRACLHRRSHDVHTKWLHWTLTQHSSTFSLFLTDADEQTVRRWKTRNAIKFYPNHLLSARTKKRSLFDPRRHLKCTLKVGEIGLGLE